MAEPRKRRQGTVSSSSRRSNVSVDKTEIRRQSRNAKSRKNKNKAVFAAAVLILAAVLAVCFIFVRKNASEISVNDAVVCTVKRSNVTSEDVKNTVEALLSEEYGTNVKINEEFALKNVHASKKDIVTMEYAISQLKQTVTYKVEAAVIIVDGSKVAVMSNTEEAQAVLDSIIQEYIPEDKNIVESGFVENVSVETDYVDSGEIMTSEEVYSKLTVGSPTTKKYSVVSNDTLYKIAANADITVEELLKANPGMTLDSTLRIGQELNLTVMEPFLSVKTAENIVFTEKQEKAVEYQQDSSKPAGYKKVTQQGQDGQKEVTTQIIRINGFESEEKVISEKTTVEPITEIIVVGTN